MATPAEIEILGRVIDPSNPSLTADAAKGFLQLSYSASDRARAEELGRKANQGTLSAEERQWLEGYVFVGDLIAMLKLKARRSLESRSPAA